jgi:hypothetical protein
MTSLFNAVITPITSRFKGLDTSLSPSSKEYQALPFEQQVFRAINLVRKNPTVFVKLLETYKNILEGNLTVSLLLKIKVKNKEEDEQTNNNNNTKDDAQGEIRQHAIF